MKIWHAFKCILETKFYLGADKLTEDFIPTDILNK